METQQGLQFGVFLHSFSCVHSFLFSLFLGDLVLVAPEVVLRPSGEDSALQDVSIKDIVLLIHLSTWVHVLHACVGSLLLVE